MPARSRRCDERLDDTCIAVWCSYQLVGATDAGHRHDVPRRTVYRHVARVEKTPELLDRARKALVAQRADTARRQGEVIDAAREALLAKIRAGRVPSRVLARLVIAGAPTSSGGGAPAMQVPAFFTKPRVDAPEAGK